MSEGMVFCQACGQQMHSTARSCPHCGAVPPTVLAMGAQGSTVNGMKDAISVCFSKYATFQGRANRAEFWYFYLFTVLVNFGFNILAAVSQSNVFAVLGGLWSLGILLPSLSVSVRRMHDVDKSGWYVLLSVASLALIFFSTMMWIGAAFAQNGSGAGLVGVVAFLAGIALMIWQLVLYCSRGTLGPNRYGGPTVA